ncbi:MAG: replication factor C small subunit [archaeon]
MVKGIDSVIWTEKYRPKLFKEVIGQEQIVKRVEAFVKQKNMPHLLFAGPAGVGKSTLALVIVRTLFKDHWKESFLELNASDARGIDIVRQNVKSFARTRAIADLPFKIVFLDESDALTKEAQQALRRTMEQFSATCRFILSCNYSSKIIDPIQSRCAIFRFRLLSEKDVEKYVDHIAKSEKLKISGNAIKILYNLSHGDLRRVLNILQASASISDKIDENLIYEVVSEIKPENISKILELACAGQFIDARNYLLDVILKQGLSGIDVIKAIQKEIWNLKISETSKIKLIERCGEIEFRLVEGSDEFVQLECLLASFIGIK